MARLDREAATDELVKQLPMDHAILFSAIRNEFDAKLDKVQTRGMVALLAGGTLGGIASTLLRPNETKAVAMAVARAVMGV